MFYEETLSAREVMRPHAITTRPSERVFELTKTMLKRRLRAVPVVGENRELVGLVTEQDCVRALCRAVYEQRPPARVADVMKTDLVTVPPNRTLIELACLFDKHPVSVLPVVEDGRCLGVVSREAVLERAVRVFEGAKDRRSAILYLSALGRPAPV